VSASPILMARGRWRGAMALATIVLTAIAALAWLFATAGWPAWGRALAAATAGLAVAAWGVHVIRAFTPVAVARHLNRILPEAEESAELLLEGPAPATGLAVLQRERILGRLAVLAPPPLPGHPVRRLSSPALGLTAVALIVALVPPAGRSGPTSADATPIGPDTAMTVALTGVTIQAPAYLGVAPRDTVAWSLEAPEGSRIEWRMVASPVVERVTLVTTAEDSVVAESTDGHLATAIVADQSLLYRVILQGGARRWASPYYRVVVDADDAPVIAVSEPTGHQEILPGSRLTFPVVATMADDYGVGGAELVVTLATGAGEGVSFREERRAFDRVRPSGPRSAVLQKTFDLAALKMSPGDELYFHIVGRDNRRPVPNSTRSATYLVRLIDTAAVVISDPQGLAVDRLPEFFRSQRQIILDTEALLAGRDTIGEEEAARRSRNIGFDQYLLRQRYSQFVGDEFEDTPLVFSDEDRAALGIVEAPAEIDPEAVAPTGEAQAKEGLDEAVRHDHDDPENATLLAQTVKGTLQASLAAMWQAELFLRTDRPAEALPHEYRALASLKQVQQSGRVYVLRTGYEPPPLEPADRLTGKAEGVRSRTVRRELAPEKAAAGGRALTVLQQLATGGRAAAGGLALLQEARAALIAEAASGAVDLAGLAALGGLIDSLASDGACAECIEPAAQALAATLGEPAPPAAGIRVAEPAVAGRYLELLGAEQR